ncbi:Trihelix transcription factor [Quillaja saponaria]|uniref:Trihelix transcription factor n=1 Tax=Quillaja saponaria TaxID=32244 RepID=A0AAD7VMX4_QUISA|nr:Trihelix transcription factor [Quillaja saponaria]
MNSVKRATWPPTTAPSRLYYSHFPGREDCWTEDATFTLIDAWGERHLELNRGNLRQKHWLEVADAVNGRHGYVKKARRTDIQCKNRIDTLKKRYKIEKARVSESDGTYTSPWPFFTHLDALIGDSFPAKRSSPPYTGYQRNTPPSKSPAWVTAHIPVGPRSGTLKRSAPATADDSYFRRKFSVFAAAAAAAAEAEEVNGSGSDDSVSSIGSPKKGRGGDKEGGGNRNSGVGYKELAQSIERFGEIYERVEAKKQRHMIELEKQRMQFAKDLEYQRMQLFMETQVQLQKIRRVKRSTR